MIGYGREGLRYGADRFDQTASDAQTRAAVMRLRRHFLYIVYSIQKSHPCQGEFWTEKILL